MSPPKHTTGHVDANLDKGKAPGTAKDIEEHVANYSEATMTITARALNTRDFLLSTSVLLSKVSLLLSKASLLLSKLVLLLISVLLPNQYNYMQL
jgi:hypothetical protein